MQLALVHKKNEDNLISVDFRQLIRPPSLADLLTPNLLLDTLTALDSLENSLENPAPNPENLATLTPRLKLLKQNLRQLLGRHTSTNKHNQILEFMALYDELTQLPNRHYFESYVTKILNASDRHQFYMVFLDLDGFKLVNDSHGHEIGDMVLQHVAKRLKHNLRSQDIVCRYGGDEFTAIIYLDQEVSIESVLQRLITSLSHPFACGELKIQIGVSIGATKHLDASLSVYDLIKKSDRAMYMAKRSGGNSYTLCD